MKKTAKRPRKKVQSLKEKQPAVLCLNFDFFVSSRKSDLLLRRFAFDLSCLHRDSRRFSCWRELWNWDHGTCAEVESLFEKLESLGLLTLCGFGLSWV
jgi:hypothetical protein